MTKPLGAPACFAAASVFSQDSNICKACHAFTECTSASFETLDSIKHLINIEDLMKRHAAARKRAELSIAAADKLLEETIPPGNHETPVIKKPVERISKSVKVSFEVCPVENKAIMRIPNRNAREFAFTLIRQNEVEAIRAAISDKRNYFENTGPAHYRIAMDMLINGGFTKSTLREKLVEELELTKETAASYVGSIHPVFTAFCFAKDIKNTFVVFPALNK